MHGLHRCRPDRHEEGVLNQVWGSFPCVMRCHPYFGHSPYGTVKSAVESFESTTHVRRAGGTSGDRVTWASTGRNGPLPSPAGGPTTRKPGDLSPVYEVRCSFRTGDGAQFTILDTREESPRIISGKSFPPSDAFVLWTLKEESRRVGGSENNLRDHSSPRLFLH